MMKWFFWLLFSSKIFFTNRKTCLLNVLGLTENFFQFSVASGRVQHFWYFINFICIVLVQRGISVGLRYRHSPSFCLSFIFNFDHHLPRLNFLDQRRAFKHAYQTLTIKVSSYVNVLSVGVHAHVLMWLFNQLCLDWRSEWKLFWTGKVWYLQFNTLRFH